MQAEESAVNSIAFVRRGCFVRSAGGGEELLDPSTVFFSNSGDEQRYDHPHAGVWRSALKGDFASAWLPYLKGAKGALAGPALVDAIADIRC